MGGALEQRERERRDGGRMTAVLLERMEGLGAKEGGMGLDMIGMDCV